MQFRQKPEAEFFLQSNTFFAYLIFAFSPNPVIYLSKLEAILSNSLFLRAYSTMRGVHFTDINPLCFRTLLDYTPQTRYTCGSKRFTFLHLSNGTPIHPHISSGGKKNTDTYLKAIALLYAMEEKRGLANSSFRRAGTYQALCPEVIISHHTARMKKSLVVVNVNTSSELLIIV